MPINIEREPSRTLIVGGSALHAGGVEAFIRRTIDGAPPSMGVLCWTFANSSILVGGNIFAAFGRFLASLAKVAFRLVTIRPERTFVHYGNGLDLIFVCLSAAFCRRVYCIAHCADGWSHLENGMTKSVVRYLIGDAKLLVLSEPQRKMFSRLGVPSIHLVPTVIGNFAETGTAPVQVRQSRLVVYSGRVCEVKGVLDAVSVVGSLSTSGSRWSLIVCGQVQAGFEGKFDASVARARAQGARVEVLGQVSEATLKSVLHSATYFLYPSRQDAFPLAILEALSCGTLPVAYDLPGAKKIIAQFGGVSVPQGDAAQIRATLEAIDSGNMSMPPVRAKQVRECYSNRRFWDHVGQIEGRSPKDVPAQRAGLPS